MSMQLDQIRPGWTAYDRNGEKIGEIEEATQSYLLVRKGLIFTSDIYVPADAVDSVDPANGRVDLKVDKARIDDMGWNEPPALRGDEGWVGATDTGTRIDAGIDAATAESRTPMAGMGTTGRATDAAGDTLRVPVHEEELSAERRQQAAGEVVVSKDVVEADVALDVPVTHDEVEVTRRTVDRPATADDAAFASGDTVRVPLTEEQVIAEKETRVVEEVEIKKRPVTETQRVEDTIRREEVRVDESSAGRTDATSPTRPTSPARPDEPPRPQPRP